MKVKLIEFNWMTSSEAGEEFSSRMVGVGGIKSISGKAPRVHGDQWNYFVLYEDGSAERIFNINRVLYYGKKETGEVSPS